MKQKYYRVTNLSLSPYIENGVYTEYEFSKDQNFHLWDGVEYQEITKEEYYDLDTGIYYRMKIENQMAREMANYFHIK
jgi:hypothetical protein